MRNSYETGPVNPDSATAKAVLALHAEWGTHEEASIPDRLDKPIPDSGDCSRCAANDSLVLSLWALADEWKARSFTHISESRYLQGSASAYLTASQALTHVLEGRKA